MGQFATRTTPSGALVVKPEGRLNMVAAPGLRKELHSLVEQGNSRIVVDLSGTDFIDSSGLGALISGLKAARQAGGDLRLAAPTRQVTNLIRVLRTHDTADGAFDDS